jgi:type III pantothenate kinase
VKTLLLIDIGNSRIKWARVVGGRRQRQRGEALRGDGATTFRSLLAAAKPGTQVLAVNVAGPGVERTLRAATRGADLPAPRFLRSAAATAGVLNGYEEAWRLGADRWAALIGARHGHEGRAACVVDIGTAMTLDLLDAAGRHRGGYIVPGPTLALATLLRDTRGILPRSRGNAGRQRAGAGWPRSTTQAIEEGSREACAAMILRTHASARRLLGGGTPRLVVTGGGAADLLPLLPRATIHVPDLVLQGVHVALGGD